MYMSAERERDKNAFKFKFGNFNIHGFCCYKHEVFLIVYIIVMKYPLQCVKWCAACCKFQNYIFEVETPALETNMNLNCILNTQGSNCWRSRQLPSETMLIWVWAMFIKCLFTQIHECSGWLYMMTTCKALWVLLIHQGNECKKATVLEVEGFPSVTTPWKLGTFIV